MEGGYLDQFESAEDAEAAGAVVHVECVEDWARHRGRPRSQVLMYESADAGPLSARAPVTIELWRTDIHGNDFFMRGFDSDEEAERERQMYEDRGHHQTYWLKRADSREEPPAP